jgi:hypothetical protein
MCGSAGALSGLPPGGVRRVAVDAPVSGSWEPTEQQHLDAVAAVPVVHRLHIGPGLPPVASARMGQRGRGQFDRVGVLVEVHQSLPNRSWPAVGEGAGRVGCVVVVSRPATASASTHSCVLGSMTGVKAALELN